MNYFLILLISSFLFSCSQKSNKSNSKSDSSETQIEIADDKLILGSWSFCAIKDSNVIAQLNRCHKIDFDKNGKGKIDLIETFDWTLKDSHLKIHNFLSPNNLTLPTGEYITSIIEGKGETTLIINQGNTSLYLVK